jgi:hypothetical protein
MRIIATVEVPTLNSIDVFRVAWDIDSMDSISQAF